MTITLHQGDITKLEVDVIVNAANSSLLGGGGVDGAIHRAGGEEILAACRKIRARQGGCPTGEAVITTGGKLPARYVVHTVGPVWQGGASEEAELLARCYRRALELAEGVEARRVAFPNISTGVYGYPKEQAARVAWSAVRDFRATHLREVVFVCFDAENFSVYERLISEE
ncbi:O-acetyl-ADP-ribose deacetylase (regulator of RNase III) [Neolewinella xylanilytica]|uniref:O-acetyl-ADP-ribose deacetylase (Regulator of RNase III) n=1 Tax=Neolewinella xylanilytica TaxID=1514080 RepID=A0A2S6I667_9BACT|nr:O-acetyl-ADP-ribose deacetylase [Neolewinella xylanilytica]PPK86654.1 O-acetyl-ADP-ribose deacetylase (regulator of RNase III) [Neolewinella xylanilytica]